MELYSVFQLARYSITLASWQQGRASDWLIFLALSYKYRCVRNARHSVLGYLSRMPKNEAAGPKS